MLRFAAVLAGEEQQPWLSNHAVDQRQGSWLAAGWDGTLLDVQVQAGFKGGRAHCMTWQCQMLQLEGQAAIASDLQSN